MKKGFTLIELLAVIVILAIIALISSPIIIGLIDDVRQKTFDIESKNIEKAAEYYLTKESNMNNVPKYKEYYIPISSLTDYLSNIKDEMLDEYVVVKETDDKISYYYTGRDKNSYLKNKTLREAVESDTTHIIKNVKVNGVTVNKVIGTKEEKITMKNWVWYSGQLWQVLETNDDYVKLITANSVTSIAYGPNSTWETSWVRKWLNEIDSGSNQDGIFYNNLSRTDLLLNGNFCLDEPTGVTLTDNKVTNFTPINSCSSIANDKIGLMTFEDYVYSLNGTDGILGALGNSYLDEDEFSWIMTKYTVDDATKKIWSTSPDNPSIIQNHWLGTTDFGRGVRSVIYLSSSLMIEENSDNNYGTISNPYRLLGEQISSTGDSLNGVTIGSYIYLSETNNPYNPTEEKVTSGLSYNYDKNKVRYRVIGINSDGSIKIQKSDILRSLPSTIAISSKTSVPFYYKQNTCDYSVGVYTDCTNHNYFKPNEGSGNYAYTESENIAYYLNNADNSYYDWFSDNVKKNIIEIKWNLPIGAYGSDYVESLFNTIYTGEYPSRSNDGLALAKIGLPQWGDMFSGNDLNDAYWYINRWYNSYYEVSFVYSSGQAYGQSAAKSIHAVRPVLNLKSNILITGGEGTPANPYTLSID